MDRTPSPEAELSELRERYATLDLAAVRAAAEPLLPSVASWRWSGPGAAAHRPEPWYWLRSRGAAAAGRWLEARADGQDADRVGFDDAGRLLVVEAHRGDGVRWVEAWEHRSDGSALGLVITPELREVVLVDGLPEPTRCLVVRENTWFFSDVPSQPAPEVWVQRESWEWMDGRAVRGTVEQLDGERFEPREAYALESTDVQDILREDGRVVWRSEPVLRAEATIAAALADGLPRAIRAGVAASGVDRPFVVEYRQGWEEPLPGFVVVGGDAFRARARSSSPRDGAALEELFRAHEGRDASLATFEVADHCDADTLLACREVNAAAAARSGSPGPTALAELASRVLTQTNEGLIASLNAPGALDGVADPFLARVMVGSSHPDEEVTEARLRRILGDEPVDRFHASIASTRARPVGRKVSLKTARGDRAGLVTWL